MKTIRRVVGRSTSERGCIAHLSLAAVGEAREFGLEVLSNRVSRSRGHTVSRYLALKDAAGRDWHLRISDHYRPGSSTHAPSHFDLVSLDGRSGLSEIRRFLLEIVSGEAIWWDRGRDDRRPPMKRRPNHKRFMGRDRRR